MLCKFLFKILRVNKFSIRSNFSGIWLFIPDLPSVCCVAYLHTILSYVIISIARMMQEKTIPKKSNPGNDTILWNDIGSKGSSIHTFESVFFGYPFLLFSVQGSSLLKFIESIIEKWHNEGSFKGQEISEGMCGVFNSPKISTKMFPKFLP